MNRRDAVKAAGASLLAGTALSSSAAGDDRERRRPRVVSIETESADEVEYDEYTVDYAGDGRVEITGYTIAPTSCYEVAVDGIYAAEYGDVVDLKLVPEKKSSRDAVSVPGQDARDDACTSIEIVRYSVELEYKVESAVNDVLVRIPEGADVDGIVTPA